MLSTPLSRLHIPIGGSHTRFFSLFAAILSEILCHVHTHPNSYKSPPALAISCPFLLLCTITGLKTDCSSSISACPAGEAFHFKKSLLDGDRMLCDRRRVGRAVGGAGSVGGLRHVSASWRPGDHLRHGQHSAAAAGRGRDCSLSPRRRCAVTMEPHRSALVCQIYGAPPTARWICLSAVIAGEQR